MSKTYTCDACGGVFDSKWSDEEAQAEAVELFGQDPADGDMAEVCDDCFKKMTAEIPPENW